MALTAPTGYRAEQLLHGRQTCPDPRDQVSKPWCGYRHVIRCRHRQQPLRQHLAIDAGVVEVLEGMVTHESGIWIRPQVRRNWLTGDAQAFRVVHRDQPELRCICTRSITPCVARLIIPAINL